MRSWSTAAYAALFHNRLTYVRQYLIKEIHRNEELLRNTCDPPSSKKISAERDDNSSSTSTSELVTPSARVLGAFVLAAGQHLSSFKFPLSQVSDDMDPDTSCKWVLKKTNLR